MEQEESSLQERQRVLEAQKMEEIRQRQIEMDLAKEEEITYRIERHNDGMQEELRLLREESELEKQELLHMYQATRGELEELRKAKLESHSREVSPIRMAADVPTTVPVPVTVPIVVPVPVAVPTSPEIPVVITPAFDITIPPHPLLDISNQLPVQVREVSLRRSPSPPDCAPDIAALPLPDRTVVAPGIPNIPKPCSTWGSSIHNVSLPSYKRSNSGSQRRGSTGSHSPSYSVMHSSRTRHSPKSTPVRSSSQIRRSLTATSEQMIPQRMSRYEALFQHSHQLNEKHRLSREQQLKEQLSECTFKPQTTRMPVSQHSKRRSSVGRNNRSQQKNSENKKPKLTTAALLEQKENSECTFRPKIGNPPPKTKVTDPTAIKGYQQAVRRIKNARQLKEISDEPQQSVSGTWTGEPTVPDPFNLELENRRVEEKAAPLVFVDVTIGRNSQVSGRIGIREGDRPEVLVESFANIYNLDLHQRERLYQTIHNTMIQHIESYRNAVEVAAVNSSPAPPPPSHFRN